MQAREPQECLFWPQLAEKALNACAASLINSKIYAGHLRGLRQAEHGQYSWCHIAQRSARTQTLLLLPVDYHEWNRVRGVSRVWPAGFRVDQHLRVPVVSRDDQSRTRRLGGLENARQRFIHC